MKGSDKDHWQVLRRFIEENAIPPLLKRPDAGAHDLLLPGQRLAFALHNCDAGYLAGKSGSYFRELRQNAENDGHRLIQIWEDQLLRREGIVLSRLASLLGCSKRIHGRSTEVQRIPKPRANAFMSENHLLGPCSAGWSYGLFHGVDLVAAASFGKARHIRRGEVLYRSVELIRFCSLNGHTVVGGLGKLIRCFIAEHSPDDISTYADLDWSEGLAYEKLGFIRNGESAPQPFRLNPHTLQREGLRSQPLDPAAPIVYNSGNYRYLLDLRNQAEGGPN
jgi:hypothetical protein